jgi:hypothetical protein
MIFGSTGGEALPISEDGIAARNASHLCCATYVARCRSPFPAGTCDAASRRKFDHSFGLRVEVALH